MTGEYVVVNLDRDVVVASRITVAGTSALRKQGLLGVKQLDSGSGIWIAPCEAVHTIGMKIPIDVVFLDRAMRVKKIIPALKPFRIALSFSAYSVLELEAGAIARSNTSVHDHLRFTPL